MPTDLIHRVGFLNPNGIPSFSPGLARSDYPGSTFQQFINPNGVVLPFHRDLIQPCQGWFQFVIHHPA
jgi:hypothetical protein